MTHGLENACRSFVTRSQRPRHPSGSLLLSHATKHLEGSKHTQHYTVLKAFCTGKLNPNFSVNTKLSVLKPSADPFESPATRFLMARRNPQQQRDTCTQTMLMPNPKSLLKIL